MTKSAAKTELEMAMESTNRFSETAHTPAPGDSDEALHTELKSLSRQEHEADHPVANTDDEQKVSAGLLARPVYLGIGSLCFSLGTIGVFVPGLPTTVFMIIALWAFTRSSPSMRAWLYNHRHFGPSLQDWEKYRSIPTRARQFALASLLVSTLVIGYNFNGLVCLAFILFVCVPVASFLWTLPASPES